MKRKVSANNARRAASRFSTKTAEDVLLRETLERFRNLLGRCGYDPDDFLKPQAAEVEPREILQAAHALRFSKVKGGGPNDVVPAARILQIWHLDPRFLADDGDPLPLPLRGEISLATLVAEVGCSVEPRTVLTTMLEARLVESCQGLSRPLGRAVIGIGEERVKAVMYSLRDMIRALDHNLAAVETQPCVFQRFVLDTNLPVSRREEYGKFFETQAMAFLESIEEWLMTAEMQARGREPLEGVNVHVFFCPRTRGIEPPQTQAEAPAMRRQTSQRGTTRGRHSQPGEQAAGATMNAAASED